MSDKRPHAERMAEIVAARAPSLKKVGFRKRRHTFNRLADDGIVHMVTFWMAPHEPAAWTEIPGLRTRRYGSFRIDFGIYVPEMNRMGSPRGAWINTYDCQMRQTMGQLMGQSSGDLWWPVDDPDSSAKASTVIETFGLPWLDRFMNDTSIISTFEREGPFPVGLSPAGPLDVADLCAARGDTTRARSILEEYTSSPVNMGHIQYLTSFLEARGHSDLVSRITVPPHHIVDMTDPYRQKA